MSALDRLQEQFLAYLQDGAPGIRAAVKDGARADRDTLLSVYRDAYVLRLHECLSIDFKAVLAILGADDFMALARDYVAAHPSTHPNVRWFGQHLPRFLRDHRLGRARPEASEMAEFEWALGLAIDAEDGEALAAADLAGLTGEQWADLTFTMRAPVRRLTLRWRTPQAWQAHGDAVPGTLAVERESGSVDWLIWRDGLDAAFRSIEGDEAWAFDAAVAGIGFGAICEGLCRFHSADSAARRGAELLRTWIDTGLLKHQSGQS